MKGRVIALCTVLVLAACASGPQPHFASPLHEAKPWSKGQWWLMDNETSPSFPKEEGCFRASLVIDSDGKVFEPKVLASVGAGLSEWLPGFFSQVRFKPAPDNPGRIPIRTTLSWSFAYSVSKPISGAPSAASVEAMTIAANQSAQVEAKAWNVQCKAAMDKLMGVDSKAYP